MMTGEKTRGDTEELCEHGIGHPIPGKRSGIHGCDGCCSGTYGKIPEAEERKPIVVNRPLPGQAVDKHLKIFGHLPTSELCDDKGSCSAMQQPSSWEEEYLKNYADLSKPELTGEQLRFIRTVIIPEVIQSQKQGMIEATKQRMDELIEDAIRRDEFGGTGKETAKILKEEIINFIRNYKQ